MATPPCQGISVINHKKNDKDIQRNSLVIESLEIIEKIKPRIFILENVQAFEKTFCVTDKNEVMRIGDYIRKRLGDEYTISSRILNFMNYGSNSSRTRTLVIGVHNKYRNNISPYDLFPQYRKEKTLREVIGSFPRLEWGEISQDDFYHAFRREEGARDSGCAGWTDRRRRLYSLAKASFPPCSSSFTFIWMMLLYRGLSRSSV